MTKTLVKEQYFGSQFEGPIMVEKGWVVGSERQLVTLSPQSGNRQRGKLVISLLSPLSLVQDPRPWIMLAILRLYLITSQSTNSLIGMPRGLTLT